MNKINTYILFLFVFSESTVVDCTYGKMQNPKSVLQNV